MRFVLLFIALLMPASVYAVEGVMRMITVHGLAERDIAPDEASLSVTIESQNRELKQVKLEHDGKLQGLYKLVASMQIPRKDMKTGYVSIRPEYDYRNGKQIFKHYRATTNINITLKDMSKIGPLMQTLVDKQYERISGVSYSIGDVEAVREEVMLDAIDNAKQKAKKMAGRLGESIGYPIEITQGYAQHDRPQPVMRVEAAMMKSADMPGSGGAIAPPPGQQQVSATVTVSFELKN